MEMDLVASARMYCVDESMSEMKARSQFIRRAPFCVTAVNRGLAASDGGAGSPRSALTTSAVMLLGAKYLSQSQQCQASRLQSHHTVDPTLPTLADEATPVPNLTLPVRA